MRGWWTLVLAGMLVEPASALAQDELPAFLVVEELASAERVEARGLREMERESAHFAARATGYRRVIEARDARERRARRGSVSRDYDARIEDARLAEHEARSRAITLLRSFVSAHPEDDESGEALWRIAELEYAAVMERGDDVPELAPVIATLSALVARFPSHPRRVDAAYLLGYALERAGDDDAARAAWLSAVDAASPLVPEIWLRVGEIEARAERAEDAIEAYRRAVEDARAPVWPIALVRLAEALVSADRGVEAIAPLVMLLDAIERDDPRAGRTGEELRAIALRWLAVALGADEPSEADVVDRAIDPARIPQDRAWTIDLLIDVGEVCFESDRYEEAMRVLELVLERAPLDVRGPRIAERIARARRRHRQQTWEYGSIAWWSEDRDTAARLFLRFARGSAWAEHNAAAHPREVARAASRAHIVSFSQLMDRAGDCHRQAQFWRRSGITTRDDSNIEVARSYYACAVEEYRRALEMEPAGPNAHYIRYNLADALFWSQRYDEAASAYGLVRDDPDDDSHRAEAARRVVLSYQYLLEDAVRTGELVLRESPPDDGAPIEPPELVQRLVHAREVYLQRIDDAHDSERVRPAYTYQNALVLYHHGHLELARARFESLLARGCDIEDARPAVVDALIDLARRRGDEAELARLRALPACATCCGLESASRPEAERSVRSTSRDRASPVR